MQTANSGTVSLQHTRHLSPGSRLTRDCRGVTQFEYAVLFVVICVGAVGAAVFFGNDLSSIF